MKTKDIDINQIKKYVALMKESTILSHCICNKGNSILYNPYNRIYKYLTKVSMPTDKLFQRFDTDVCKVKTLEQAMAFVPGVL